MKKIILFLSIISVFISCQEKYELNTNYSLPTEFFGPTDLILDVTSTTPVEFYWTGGGAEDGSYAIYEVLFDKLDGDFSDPVFRSYSDQKGGAAMFTTSQSVINTIAREAGIFPSTTGKLKWKVIVSKGGETKTSDIITDFNVTRGEGIDNIPQELYLYGTATENGGNGGLKFRNVTEGVFTIYTTIPVDGNLYYKNATSGTTFSYFLNNENKIQEGDGVQNVNMYASPVRITVDFNSLTVTTDLIDNVRMIFGCNYGEIAQLPYVAPGKFVADRAYIQFVDPSRPETNPPGWLSWTEERYYFIVNINGTDYCWGRMDDISAERPDDVEILIEFYELGEFEWSQWDHLWKLATNLDLKYAKITIDTDNTNMMIHSFEIVP